MVINTMTKSVNFFNVKITLAKYFFIVLTTLMLFSFSNQSYAVNISVKVSHNPISLDDSFHLIYEADSSVDGDPDFSPLEKYFDILNSSQSTNMRLINGNYSLKKTWDLALMPRDIGSFTVPPISFGKDKSPSIHITITNSVTPNSTLPNGQASIPAKIFLESSVNKKIAHVQEQIIYSVRLLRTVNITGASLSTPTTSDQDAIIQRLGKDFSYQTTRHGIRYDVIERRYVIYPQHSGTLTIKPVTFQGRVNAMQPRTIFDQFGMGGQLKQLRSPAIKLSIKAKPANISSQNWLPASKLTLHDNWSADIHHAKTGNPITRTITITAEGQTGAFLPDLKFNNIANLKQYPDKAVTKDQTNSNGITGQRQTKIAMIPARPGNYVLPEIKLPWWNTHTHREEMAILPAITLHVSGAVQATQSTLPPQAPAPTSNKTATTPSLPAALQNNNRLWQWISLALAAGWLLTLIYLFTTRRRFTASATTEKKPAPALAPGEKAAREKAVLRACKQNQPEIIKNALLAWAQAYWPQQHISSLSQLSALCSPGLKQEIILLNQTLYDPQTRQSGLSSTHTKALADAFKQFRTSRKKSKQADETVLEPLYKT